MTTVVCVPLYSAGVFVITWTGPVDIHIMFRRRPGRARGWLELRVGIGQKHEASQLGKPYKPVWVLGGV